MYPKLIEDLPPGSKEPSIEESAQTIAAVLLCGYRPPADNQPGWLTQPERDTMFQGRSKEAAAAVLASATHRATFQGAGPPAWRYLVARVEARPVQADEAARLEAAQAKLAATSEELLARVGAEFEAQRRKIEETTKPLRDMYKEPTMKAVRQELAKTSVPDVFVDYVLRCYLASRFPSINQALKESPLRGGPRPGRSTVDRWLGRIADSMRRHGLPSGRRQHTGKTGDGRRRRAGHIDPETCEEPTELSPYESASERDDFEN